MASCHRMALAVTAACVLSAAGARAEPEKCSRFLPDIGRTAEVECPKANAKTPAATPTPAPEPAAPEPTPQTATPAPTPPAATPSASPPPASSENNQAGLQFKDCDTCPVMVVVPAGSFTMGTPKEEFVNDDDERPQHTVKIPSAFAIGRFEITVDEYGAFIDASGYQFEEKCYTREGGVFQQRSRTFRNPGMPQDGRHPALCIGWKDAEAYTKWLSEKTGQAYRLPSESEWEYAARGGTSTAYYFGGEREQQVCANGNGADETGRAAIAFLNPISDCADGHAYTAPVGSYPPNPFGLYDMAGNASEWTADCWHRTYDGAPNDGSAWTAEQDGVCIEITRGGSWEDYYGRMRSGDRNTQTQRQWNFGFRVARTLPR